MCSLRCWPVAGRAAAVAVVPAAAERFDSAAGPLAGRAAAAAVVVERRAAAAPDGPSFCAASGSR